MNATPIVLPATLKNEEVLFRVLTRSKWREAPLLAFLLEEHERETGLSVAFNCTSEEAEAEFDSYGVRSLIANQVVKLGLKVVPDEPTHANIQNLPHKEDNEVEAMRIAEELSQLSVAVRIRDKRQAKTQP